MISIESDRLPDGTQTGEMIISIRLSWATDPQLLFAVHCSLLKISEEFSMELFDCDTQINFGNHGSKIKQYSSAPQKIVTSLGRVRSL